MTIPVAPTVPLLHGAQMPRIGLGTWPMDDAESERVVADAIGAGYRLIDTAENYRNERGVGRGIKASAIPRDELFITSKFNKRWHGRDLVAQAYEQSLDRLGLEYLDLLLIHWPNPQQDRYVQAWLGLIDLWASGRVRAIGTSNFTPEHLNRIIDASGVVPDVNQIQLSPLHIREAARAYHAGHGIVTESWSPIGGDGANVLDEAAVQAIAQDVDRTPAQVVLRWHLELGLVAVPKSADPDRLRQNLAVFDFRLNPEQLAALSALDLGERSAIDSESFGH